MTKERSSEDRLAIGRLGAPRGVRGELKVHSYSGEFGHFLGLKEVEVEAENRRLRLKVRSVEESGGGIVMAFEGYESPEVARSLTGMDIVVARKAAAPLRENEWYVGDLVGLSLVSDGKTLAKVRSVLDGGREPWLEAVLAEGRTCLVPFRKEFVGEVDPGKGTIELLAPWILE